MKTAKQTFKAKYSSYRKSVGTAYNSGLESFRTTLNGDAFLKRIYLNRELNLPVSMKIWAYKNNLSISKN